MSQQSGNRRQIHRLDEADVHTLLAREPGHRNRVLLRLLYRAGLRVSEIAGLCWRDVHARDDGGQVTVFGKGGKTRTVLLPADVWRDLVSPRRCQPRGPGLPSSKSVAETGLPSLTHTCR